MMNQIPTKTFSTIQEIKISSSLGWKVVSASGARDCLPGDVEGPEWLGECKTHTKRTARVAFIFDVWTKISNEATSHFKRPVLFVDDGSQLLEYTWCIIPACDHEGVSVPFPPTAKLYSIKTNISFASNSLRKYLHDLNDSENWEDNYISTMWHGQPVHLLRFSQFARWFGEPT